jgi:hypothetical protein
MNAAKLFIADELLLLHDWYKGEKEVLKKRINENDQIEKQKLLRKISFYNTRIIVIKVHFDELKKVKKNYLLTNLQLN